MKWQVLDMPMAPLADSEIWERQLGESTPSYTAWCVYRDMGKHRSLRKTHAEMVRTGVYHGKTLPPQFLEWSNKWRWPARAAAYDLHMERLVRQQREEEILAMNKRHITLAQSLQAKAAEKLRGLAASSLRMDTLLRYVIEAAKLERLARGEPETVVRQQQESTPGRENLDLRKLTAEEVSLLERLISKALVTETAEPAQASADGGAPEPN